MAKITNHFCDKAIEDWFPSYLYSLSLSDSFCSPSLKKARCHVVMKRPTRQGTERGFQPIPPKI
jgi:hypothetical protein